MRLTRKRPGRMLRRRDPDDDGLDKNKQPPGRLEELALQVVVQAYESWRRVCKTYRDHGLRAPEEPSITVGIIKHSIHQIGAKPYAYEWTVSRKQYQMLRTVLAKLVKAGKLTKSQGLSMRGNGEATCYEPGPRA